MTCVCLTSRSGPVLLRQHHGASTLAVTVPVVSVRSVAATVATVPIVEIVRTVVFAPLGVAAPHPVASAVLPLAKTTAVSATTTVVIATDPGALLTATAK